MSCNAGAWSRKHMPVHAIRGADESRVHWDERVVKPVSLPENQAPVYPPIPETAVTPAPVPPLFPDENPSWSGWEVLALAVTTFVVLVSCVVGTAYFVHHRFSPTAPMVEALKRPEVIVGGQLLAYFLV